MHSRPVQTKRRGACESGARLLLCLSLLELLYVVCDALLI